MCIAIRRYTPLPALMLCYTQRSLHELTWFKGTRRVSTWQNGLKVPKFSWVKGTRRMRANTQPSRHATATGKEAPEKDV